MTSDALSRRREKGRRELTPEEERNETSEPENSSRLSHLNGRYFLVGRRGKDTAEEKAATSLAR